MGVYIMAFKYKLVDMTSDDILTYSDDNTIVFTDWWGELQTQGILVWQDNTPTEAEVLEEAKRQQLTLMSKAASITYIGGFKSSATGESLWYDSDTDTQTIINRQYQIALGSPEIYSATLFFLGAPVGVTPIRAKVNQSDLDSTKTIEYFNADEMIILGNDLALLWSTTKTKLWGLQAQINAATTVEAVQLLVW